jgi:hypothetical protein
MKKHSNTLRGLRGKATRCKYTNIYKQLIFMYIICVHSVCKCEVRKYV